MYAGDAPYPVRRAVLTSLYLEIYDTKHLLKKIL
jgi:hypothetical protein